MKPKQLLFITLLFSLVISIQTGFSDVKADDFLTLDEINPETSRLGVFNSFKHRLLLVAITKKNNSPFDCQPNRYIFYDYKKEKYFEILAGNLKISSDYSKMIKTKIHTIVSTAPDNSTEWKENVKNLLEAMNISSETMEKGKSLSTDGTAACWQQPALVDLSSGAEKAFYNKDYIQHNRPEAGPA